MAFVQTEHVLVWLFENNWTRPCGDDIFCLVFRAGDVFITTSFRTRDVRTRCPARERSFFAFRSAFRFAHVFHPKDDWFAHAFGWQIVLYRVYVLKRRSRRRQMATAGMDGMALYLYLFVLFYFPKSFIYPSRKINTIRVRQLTHGIHTLKYLMYKNKILRLRRRKNLIVHNVQYHCSYRDNKKKTIECTTRWQTNNYVMVTETVRGCVRTKNENSIENKHFKHIARHVQRYFKNVNIKYYLQNRHLNRQW